MAGRDDDKDKTVFGGPPQGQPQGQPRGQQQGQPPGQPRATTDIWSRGPQGQGGDDGRTMIGRPGQAGSPFGGDQHTASPFGQPQGMKAGTYPARVTIDETFVFETSGRFHLQTVVDLFKNASGASGS